LPGKGRVYEKISKDLKGEEKRTDASLQQQERKEGFYGRALGKKGREAVVAGSLKTHRPVNVKT